MKEFLCVYNDDFVIIVYAKVLANSEQEAREKFIKYLLKQDDIRKVYDEFIISTLVEEIEIIK